jgi:hypothetical protein
MKLAFLLGAGLFVAIYAIWAITACVVAVLALANIG